MAIVGATSHANCPDRSIGILCVHGFTSSPSVFKTIEKHLVDKGFLVSVPLLPGHGTSLKDLHLVTAKQWIRCVGAAYDDLAGRSSQVIVIGQSLGGLLVTCLAAERPKKLAGVAVLAMPLSLFPVGTKATSLFQRRWVRQLIPGIPKISGQDIRDKVAARTINSYSAISSHGLVQVANMMKKARKKLPQVKAPMMIVHGYNDHTAPFASALQTASLTGSENVRFLALEKSYHLVTSDVERETVAAQLLQFIEEVLTPASQ